VSVVVALEGVSASRDGVPVLHDVSLAVSRGEVVALLGPSGAGKSTLLRVVLGLSTPTDGRVRVHGTIVSADQRVIVPPEERNLGMVFQDLALWPHLTVRGNLAFALQSQRVDRSEREHRIEKWLRRLELLDKRDRRPGSLSGGERQRVALARALVLEPAAILMDEPLTSLDVVLRRQILELLRALLAEHETAALYVTHDPREAGQLAQRLVVMDHGRIIQTGRLDELRQRPASDFVRALISEAS
jgi:iron(III) transport system ATP-binding protein